MKRPVSDVPASIDPALARVVNALKENQQEMMGHRGGSPLDELASTATTAEIIDKINAIIRRMQ